MVERVGLNWDERGKQDKMYLTRNYVLNTFNTYLRVNCI